MIWQNLLRPNLALSGTVVEITPALLQQHGLQGLILDIDETLVPSGVPTASEALIQWLQTLHSNYPIWLVTNNLNALRIKRIATALDLPYLLGAAKPSRRKLRQALQAMQLPPHQVAMVGDRLLTDVLAGNRLGLFTILVKPMGNAGQIGAASWFHLVEAWASQSLLSQDSTGVAKIRSKA